jgi:C-terminal processing protease CtpA/Prc
MAYQRLGTALSIMALLAACGGGGGGGGGTGGGGDGGAVTPPPTSGAPPPPPPATSAACSVRERQDWVAAQLNEWYLFPETLPASLSPAGYGNVDDYLDALTATARSQSKDRYFTYLTSIAEENAYYSSGSSAGFGIRLSYDSAQRRLFVEEAFENTPALAAGIDRGTEILAIGTTAGSLRLVSELFTSGGSAAVNAALGPPDPGLTRVLRVSGPGGPREVTVTKADYTLLPVSPRYGAKVLDDGGKKVGYVNLRTFISTADPALRDAFAQFRAQGVSEVIIDLRYNGGGLVRIAELMGDLLGADRSSSDVFSHTAFRPSKSQENSTRVFQPQPQSIAPTRIAFIGTGGSASASELVINSFVPYLGNRAALVGTNTYGKPVGQIALDRTACDDRLRVVAFATQNKLRQGDYYTGLASKMQATCQAPDDLTRQMGDPLEGSTRQALDFLAGRSCTPIGGGTGTASTQAFRDGVQRRTLLMPDRPDTAQREVPGAF